MIRNIIDNIIADKLYSTEDLSLVLQCNDDDRMYLFKKSQEIKEKYVGKKVYFRGLIEYSNICAKNCYYCGIRRDNKALERYTMTNDEVIEAAMFAHKKRYGSIVIQSGEISSPTFIENITYLLKQIKKLSNSELGITLSLGEQSEKNISTMVRSRSTSLFASYRNLKQRTLRKNSSQRSSPSLRK